MSTPHEPTPDQLTAMAYADGELSADERRAFEARLATDAALAREVAAVQTLNLLGRHAAPPEPADHEWARLAVDPVQRGGHALSWALLFGFAAAVAGLGLWAVWTADGLHVAVRVLLTGGAVGAVLLLLLTVRERLAVLPFDPYRNVHR